MPNDQSALDLRAAAAEAPERAAVIAGTETITFAELADAVLAMPPPPGAPGIPHAFVATGDVETLRAIHRALLRRAPFLPLHPRLTATERSSLVEAFGKRAVPPDVAAVVPTSGTTGRPKGVMISRSALVASARASEANLGWQGEDRWLLCMPLAHVGGLSVVTRTLIARRTLVLLPRFEPARVAETIAWHRVTLVSLVPAMLHALLAEGWRPPPHLRAVLLGGAAANGPLLDRAREAGVPVLGSYGLTEACSQVTTWRPGTVPSVDEGAGPPLPGIEVRIGEGGRIEVRGASLMRGYLMPGDAGAAADDARVADPFDADGWFRTGDRGRLDAEGRLHVLGRASEVIVTGGENVDPLEIEAVLEQHPAVEAACVAGVPDEVYGEVVGALVVAREDTTIDPEALMTFARGRLASHKGPRIVRVVDALPRTRSGKPDRRAAARALAAFDPAAG